MGAMRRFSPAFLVPVVVLAGSLIGPSAASAATQVGQTFAGATGSCDTGTALQSSSPGSPPQYAAPSAGVITAWSFRATPIAPTLIKLKVARPAGGNRFTIVGESPPKRPAGGVLSTYTDVRIAASPGDVIGFYVESASDDAECFRSAPGFGFHFGTDRPPGSTAAYTPSGLSSQMSISARLEPDADGDGFGDESQDQCPTDASTQGPCPGPLALDLEAKKQKLRKKIKFFATASVTSTLVAEGKKTRDIETQLIANQETKIKAKLKRKARNRLAEKLDEKGKAKVKVKGTATTQSGAEATDKVKVKLKD
jgi:hypothetical protein